MRMTSMQMSFPETVSDSLCKILCDICGIVLCDWPYPESEWALLAWYVYTYAEFVIVTEAPLCNRRTATGQDTDNKVQYTNIQMYKMAKTQYTIQTVMCEVWHVQIWNIKISVWWINNCIIVLCVPCLMSSVHEMNMPNSCGQLKAHLCNNHAVNQHLDMSHLWGGWLSRQKRSAH